LVTPAFYTPRQSQPPKYKVKLKLPLYKVKLKLPLCFNRGTRHEGVLGRGGTVPRILETPTL